MVNNDVNIKVVSAIAQIAIIFLFLDAKMQLDIPFSLKFVNEMKKQGIVLKREIQMEKVVDELCRLRFEN